MKVGARNVKVDNVIGLLSNRQDFKGASLRKSEMNSRLARVSELVLLEEKSKNLETKYPEFGSLMIEYQDGVVLYKAEQMEIWNKLSINDTTLNAYFDANREKFAFPDRVDYSEIYVKSDSLAKEISKQLQEGANFDTLAEHYNEEADLKAKKGAHGLTNTDDSEMAKKAWGMGVGIVSEPVSTEDSGFSIIKINSKDPAHQKSFQEAGVEVSNAFQGAEQKRLETEWLDRIKAKYPVSTNPEVLPKAFTD